MVCALRAVELGHCPEKFKFMHFDSHPDLGCFPEEEAELLDECYNGAPSIKKLYATTDIATWIIPMVLMGHCDTVVWACGNWCTQFNPGKWPLLAGKDKKDGKLKIACKGNKKWACLEYWKSGDCVCKEEDLEYSREWTLQVVRYNKEGKLPAKQYNALCDEFGDGSPWVLDIDEDFFSCNNPYRDEFWDLFGKDVYTSLTTVYDGYDQDETNTGIKEMFKFKDYLKPWSKFKNLKCVELVMENICLPKRQAEKHMRRFHEFLRKNFPNADFDDSSEEEEGDEDEGGEEDEEEDTKEDEEDDVASEEWTIPDFFSLNDLHRVGGLSCLPHHISNANQIKTMVNEVNALLSDLTDPVLVTVATSRLDRYLPDSQAVLIHGLVENFLKERYDTDNIQRWDRPKYSVDNVAHEDMDDVIAREILELCSSDEE